MLKLKRATKEASGWLRNSEQKYVWCPVYRGAGHILKDLAGPVTTIFLPTGSRRAEVSDGIVGTVESASLLSL